LTAECCYPKNTAIDTTVLVNLGTHAFISLGGILGLEVVGQQVPFRMSFRNIRHLQTKFMAIICFPAAVHVTTLFNSANFFSKIFILF
jgi:hypothetical protein